MASALKTQAMPKVHVREDESLKSALQRLRESVNSAYRRQFYKTRVGCYEKLSDRRRRQMRAAARRVQLRERFGPVDMTVYIGLRSLHSRGEDPFRS